MGTQQQQLRVTAATSTNNGQRQQDHEGLWEELAHRIDMIVREHRYQEIMAMKS